MRNLLGRLNARSPDELARIAAFWGVLLAGGPGGRHRQVGQLYRALTDPRAVRDVWDRLSAEERALVRLLALGEGGDETALTVAEIAARLGVSEAEARRTAGSLYRAGIVVREGDDAELPPGVAPRLFLPRELAQLFRRVQDEIEAGDLSGTPLRALLELLDDAELEEAATIWGLNVIPGLRRREDLSRQILQQIAAERIETVAARRRVDARKIWERVRAEPAAAPVPMAEAAGAAGLDSDGDRAVRRLREALAELETALLVWHTYRPDGSRWLFVPTEVRRPRAAPKPDTPLPEPLPAASVEQPPWRHPAALAWDLLTLLRELTGEALPVSERGHGQPAFPRARLRRLNRHLWHAGDDLPPPGYLGLLLALAEAEGLVRLADADGHPTIEVTPAVRGWRDRSFADQTARLRELWLALPEWIEGRERETVVVWGADWRGFRRRLLRLLEELPPEVWFPVEGIAAWAAGRDPELLGATFTAATARRAGDPDEGPGERRRAAVAEVVAVALETAPLWFGLVQVVAPPGQPKVVRRPAAVALDGEADEGATKAAPIAVEPDGEIRLRRPNSVRVWSLSAFADLVRLGAESRYRLSAEGMARALAAGFDLDQVTGFLSRQSGGALPPEVAGQLQGWARGYGRIRLRRALLLMPDDPATLPAILAALSGAGWSGRLVGDETLLVELPAEGGPETGEHALLTLLRAQGHAPHWSSPEGKADRAKSKG
jgi:hypothetical protein